MTLRVLVLLAACALFGRAFGASGDVSPAQPIVPVRVFKVRVFGAVGDGTTLDTAAFARAIAAVEKAGGGRLVVPAGNWFTGPLDLCSALDFHLEAGATIFFSPKFED